MFDDKHLPSRGKYYSRDNYNFVCLCRSSAKVVAVLFDQFFHIIYASVAHFYVIFIEYLMVAMFAEMLFNQF